MWEKSSGSGTCDVCECVCVRVRVRSSACGVYSHPPWFAQPRLLHRSKALVPIKPSPCLPIRPPLQNMRRVSAVCRGDDESERPRLVARLAVACAVMCAVRSAPMMEFVESQSQHADFSYKRGLCRARVQCATDARMGRAWACEQPGKVTHVNCRSGRHISF
jgi:hypothetical protein